MNRKNFLKKYYYSNNWNWKCFWRLLLNFFGHLMIWIIFANRFAICAELLLLSCREDERTGSEWEESSWKFFLQVTRCLKKKGEKKRTYKTKKKYMYTYYKMGRRTGGRKWRGRWRGSNTHTRRRKLLGRLD
jgi:hypothetical protein